MKIFYPYLFKATFSKPRFEVPILHNCLEKYAYDTTIIHRKKRDQDLAFVFVNEWKENDHVYDLIEKFDKYDNVKVRHNGRDHWIFSPIFQTEVPSIQLNVPLKIIEYKSIELEYV